jgi:tRNA A-37 threonylcarbamoyl transferase component Bud32
VTLPAHRSHTIRGLGNGTRLGRYVVVRRIGSGGMAELYLARLDGPQRFVKPVALKLMHAHLADQPGFLDMFLKEARIAAALDHPGIVQVLDVGSWEGEHFLALEYVHGRDLRQILSEVRPERVPLGCAVRIVLEVGAALQFAHQLSDATGRPLQIVHRDVSPSNVLVSYGGAVKLADFGVARIVEHTHATVTGSLKGKLGYMSPEQCMQEQVDARSDVFALAVTLYEATTGRRAFHGDQPVAVMNRVIDGQWTPPSEIVPGYPKRLHEIVARGLAVDLDERYASAAMLCEDLQAFAVAAGLDTRPETLGAFMMVRYGAPALPDLSVATVVHTSPSVVDTTTVEDTRPTVAARRARRLPATLVLGGVLGLGGLAGWQVARSTAEPVATAPAPAAAIAPASAPVVAEPTAADVPAPPLPVPIVVQPEVGADEAAAPSVAQPSSSSSVRKRRVSRRDRKSKAQPKSNDLTRAELDAPFPPTR